MSFSETTAKITSREKNTVCTYFSLQWVACWRVPENTKANHQQREETLPFLNLINHSRVSRCTFATKQGLVPLFNSNQLHKLHCMKAKQNQTKKGIYLKSSITVHVFSLALEHQTNKNMWLVETALGLFERYVPPTYSTVKRCK